MSPSEPTPPATDDSDDAISTLDLGHIATSEGERFAVAFCRILRQAGVRLPPSATINFVDALGRAVEGCDELGRRRAPHAHLAVARADGESSPIG